MVSTDTSNSFAKNTYPAEAIENNAPVRPDVKALRDGGRELRSAFEGRLGRRPLTASRNKLPSSTSASST